MAVDDQYTKLLLHCDEIPLVDESGKTITNTNGNIIDPTPVIPVMTANDAPSPFLVSINYAIYAAGYEIYKAFDRLSSTICHSASGFTSGIITMSMDTGYTVQSYRIVPQSGYPTRTPKNWTFEGSNNGTDWTVVETRENVTSWTNAGTIFNFTNSTSYSYYRLNITATNSTYLVLTEIQLYVSNNNFGKMVYLPGGAFLSIPASDDFYMGTGDCTFDFRVKFNAITGDQAIFSNYASDSDWYGLVLTNSGKWTFVIDNEVSLEFSGSTIVAGTIYHVELSRSGNDWRLFLNGTQYGSTRTNTRVIDQINGPLYIGQLRASTFYVNACIDEIRVSKGIARHTANFTPPTVPYGESVPVSNRIILATFI